METRSKRVLSPQRCTHDEKFKLGAQESMKHNQRDTSQASSFYFFQMSGESPLLHVSTWSKEMILGH